MKEFKPGDRVRFEQPDTMSHNMLGVVVRSNPSTTLVSWDELDGQHVGVSTDLLRPDEPCEIAL